MLESGAYGFRLRTPVRAASNVAPGVELKLFTRLLVREDHLVLYGFDTSVDRDLFVVLIGVSGLGPEKALALLGALSPAAIATAVRRRDAKRFQLVKGVGAKLAQKIVLELEGKLEAFETATEGASYADGATPRATGDVIATLISLGFPRGTAEAASRAAIESEGEAADVESLVKAALRRLQSSA